jgi:TonB family protein
MRREQEEACDDAVLHSGFEPAIYAEALLAVAKDAPAALFSGCPMATQTGLKSRITRLLCAGITRRTSRVAFLAAALISAGILVAFVALSPVRAQQVYKAGGDVTSPRVVYRTDIPYTEEARSERVDGTVILSFVVGTDGLAHDIGIRQHLDSGLERNAAESLEQWRFAPGTLNGVPVPVEATVQVNFKLQ